jgi:hypothetical protein
MGKFITVKLGLSITDAEKEEQFERMGIKGDFSEDFDSECDINLFAVEAYYDSQFADGAPFTNVILQSGVQLPVLMGFKEFKALMKKHVS